MSHLDAMSAADPYAHPGPGKHNPRFRKLNLCAYATYRLRFSVSAGYPGGGVEGGIKAYSKTSL
eukprot:573726-Amorphochlora_amoeboformis.AAC.3